MGALAFTWPESGILTWYLIACFLSIFITHRRNHRSVHVRPCCILTVVTWAVFKDFYLKL